MKRKKINVKNITDEQLIQDYKNELLYEDGKRAEGYSDSY